MSSHGPVLPDVLPQAPWLEPPRPPGAIRRALSRHRRPIGVAVSIAVHAGALVALLAARAEPPRVYAPQLMSLVLIDLPPPAEPIAPKPPAAPVKAQAPQRKNIFRETPLPPPPDAEPMPAGEAETPSPGVELSDAQIAGAATAGPGAPGGACNMPRLLQNALRKDRMVQAAVASIHRGKAIAIWNGDWVRHGGQEGNGLAAVREAIMWEIGFAPAECRKQAMHGLVLISLDDSPGAPRIVLGDGAWRWSDLLFSPSAPGG